MNTMNKIRPTEIHENGFVRFDPPINLTDDEWRDDDKVLDAFWWKRDELCEDEIGTPWDSLDKGPAHNPQSKIQCGDSSPDIKGFVGRLIARNMRQDCWEGYADCGMADYDDDMIGDDLHFLLYNCHFKSDIHLAQAVKVLNWTVTSWSRLAKIKYWYGGSFMSAAEHCDYLRGAVGNLKQIQGRYFERQRDKHSKREDKFDGTEETVEWCNENRFNVDSLCSDDCGILSMLFEFRDLVKGVSEEDYDDICDETEDSYGDIFETCGELCESPESILFRRRVIDEIQRLHQYSSGDAYDATIDRLKVIEEYQTLSNINKEAA
jgi:hypothetical protein